jgi:hypothetical protein
MDFVPLRKCLNCGESKNKIRFAHPVADPLPVQLLSVDAKGCWIVFVCFTKLILF